MVSAIRWEGGKLLLLDQRLLPGQVEYRAYSDYREVAGAIRDMVVRGAPAIGIAAAYGMALAAAEARYLVGSDPARIKDFLQGAADSLMAARPTAVNLAWAVRRVLNQALQALAEEGLEAAAHAAVREAMAIEEDDVRTNELIGENGAQMVPKGFVLTHCNAGALATGGHGTALAVIRKAWALGKVNGVYVDETRPYLQGSRLTAWELIQDGIPVTLIVDSCAGYLMKKGLVQWVVVGADRIAASGDVANKIGTYSLACLARDHGVSFFVAAPRSTFDLGLDSGDDIPIEERPESEVLEFRGTRVAPAGAKAYNPAFDVTPAHLVTAIITERGVVQPVTREKILETLGCPAEPS